MSIFTKQKDFKAFKTKKGRSVFDGGGVQPDIEIALSKQTPITKAIEGEYLIFDFVTEYYYDNEISNLEDFNLSDADFNAFTSYLESNNFNFETKTEQALDKAFEIAKKEAIDEGISAEYNDLMSALNDYKSSSITKNKAQLTLLLRDEIIKRYFYAEGLYEYYKSNNKEIIEAIDILSDPSKYNKILN